MVFLCVRLIVGFMAVKGIVFSLPVVFFSQLFKLISFLRCSVRDAHCQCFSPHPGFSAC